MNENLDHTAEYVLLWRDIKPSGWSLKMIWARMRRRKLEVYTHPKAMTDLELTRAVILGVDMDCMPEIYMRLEYEGASDWAGTILPTIPDDEGDK